MQTFPHTIYDHLSRNNIKRNPLSNLLRQFLEQNNLNLYDVTDGVGPTVTYKHKTMPNSSYIDHIAMCKDSPPLFSNCETHEEDELNLSDHQPVSISIQLPTPSLPQILKKDCKNIVPPRSVWKDATFLVNYDAVVAAKLADEEIETTNLEHDLQKVCKILHTSAVEAYEISKSHQQQHSHSKNWWTPELTNLKRVLSTHFNTWKRCGFPRDNGVEHCCFLLARKNFRKAVKKCQNKKVYDIYFKINALKKTHPKKFWKKIRQLKNSEARRPFELNGKKENSEIVEEFADNFNTRLNNPVIEQETFTRPIPAAPPHISNCDITVSTEDIKSVIKKLKLHKTSDPFFLTSEHIIFAESESLVNWMSNFYNRIFEQNNTPISLSTSIIHPLVKSYKKSLQNFNNYRGISIIPVFTKVLEYLILAKCPEIAASHHLQFGYKDLSSTLHAEFLIKETIQYYNKNGSSVYVCGLDAEKAFDSCNWDILFEKLYYDKKLPLAVVNVVKSLYVNGSACVKYNGEMSYEFSLSQGVRQGSVLSPHLYNIYTEDLLEEMNDNVKCGTSLYGQFTGITMYADDIILMSSTLSGLREMLRTCVRISTKKCLNFNSDKTEFCISNNNGLESIILMNGYTIRPKDGFKHLGFFWNSKRNLLTMEDNNVSTRIGKLWSVVQALVKGGIRFCHPSTIRQVFQSLVIPTLSYGIELCTLSNTLLNRLDTESRKALKTLFNISAYSKNYLHTLLNIEHTSTTLINNKFGLLIRLLRNEKTADVIMKMAASAKYSSFVHDLQDLASGLGLDLRTILISRSYKKVVSVYEDMDDDRRVALTASLDNWNLPESRKRFVDIFEERVVRPS